MNPWRAARRCLPAVVPFLLAVVLFAPATVGGDVLSSSDLQLFGAPFPPPPPGAAPKNGLQFDAGFVFEPDGLFVRRTLRDGRLPIWSPHLAAGQPLLAAQQSAPLFPLNWLGVAFGFFDALVWIAVLKLTLAALGTALLARAHGLGRAPALLAGISFGFGTYLVDWLGHPHANAYLLLPWLFLGAERVCRSGRVRDAALLGGGFGLAFLGGQPESSLIVTLAAAGWVAHRLAAYRPARAVAVRRVALTAGAVVLGLGIAAVMLLPFVEALHASSHVSRSQPPLARRAIFSALFPRYWPDGPAGAGGGLSNFTERTFYVGALPLLLAAAGLVARRPRGAQLFFAVLAAVALVIALDTGPVASGVAGLPGLDLVNLTRLLVLAEFGLALLAAFGLDRLLAGNGEERRRMLVAAAVLALLPPLVAVGLHPSLLGDLPDLVARSGAPSRNVQALDSVLRWLGFAVVSLGVLAALALHRGRVPLLVATALAVTAVDLLVLDAGFNPAIPKAQAEPPTPRSVEALRRVAGDGRVVGLGALQPNMASRWGLDDLRGHENPSVERVQRLFFALGGGIDGATTGVQPLDPRTPKLLDVFGVRAVLFPPSATHPAATAYAGTDGVIVENPSAFPRAFVAYRWRRSAGLDQSLSMMGAGPARAALDDPVLETAAPPPAGVAHAATPARGAARTDTTVTLDVRAQAPGRLVLLDTFYPGWKAWVDRRETRIDPANAAFRSVAVPAGRHTVRFAYEPASVRTGETISIIALALLALALLADRLRRRRSKEVPLREFEP